MAPGNVYDTFVCMKTMSRRAAGSILKTHGKETAMRDDRISISRPLRILLPGLLLALLLLAARALPARAEPLQDCHRVENSYTDTKQKNGSLIRLWHVETANPAVTSEINALAEAWAAELGPDLPKGINQGKKNSRLDVEIRYSRTGLRWMSFLVQARTTYHTKLMDQRFTTRTYDMITGERVLFSGLFNDDEALWALLSDGVRQGLAAYWPEVEPDPAALDALCTREALEQAEFTLHGMSLVLHYPAELLYEGKKTLMEISFFYPTLRDYMTESAYAQTNNLAYYKTCAMTFDDGPSAENTPKVLNSLMKKGVRATFFVIGNRVGDYRYLVQREHDNGHAVASHNWHHGNVTKSSPAALRRMPEKVNTAMIRAIGIPVRYDRVPGGRYPPMISARVQWAYIQWSLDTYDWRGNSTATIMKKVRKTLQDGDIILCHDIKDKASATTLEMVDYLEEQGYMLLTVDELFAKDGVTLEPLKVYYRCQDGDTSKR